MPQLTWLITGCSPGGLGEQLALKVLSRGDKVIATARNGEKRLEHLKNAGAAILDLDTIWTASELSATAQRAINVFGSIDVLVNNAGYVEGGAVEELTDDLLLKSMQVNALGALNLTRALLPHFRERKTGTVLFISSIGPYMLEKIAGGAAYMASKAYIEVMAQTLQEETAPYGIRYSLILAGYLRTKLLEPPNFKHSTLQQEGTNYDQFNKFMLQMINQMSGNQAGDPAKAADAIVDAVRSEGSAAGKKLPFRLPLGADTIPIMRAKADELLAVSKEWEDVANSIAI